MSLSLTGTYPRTTLSYREKQQLENQFIEQVPEYKNYGIQRKKHRQMGNNIALGTSIVSGIVAYQRTFQPITGLVFVAATFTATKLLHNLVMGPSYGLTLKKNSEYDRAFNLWVYYTQKEKQLIKKPTLH
ncbi:hypothetical protein ABK040_001351 [Willaertia magna]